MKRFQIATLFLVFLMTCGADLAAAGLWHGPHFAHGKQGNAMGRKHYKSRNSHHQAAHAKGAGSHHKRSAR